LEIIQDWSRGQGNWQGDADVAFHFYTLDPDKDGCGFGTLYALAQQNGYTKPLPQHEREASKIFGATVKEHIKQPEGFGEPADIFGDGSMTPEPVLTRGMLPKVIADFAWDAAERLGVDPAMLAMPALVVCASALDDKIQIQPKEHDTEWQESARLWIATLAPSGGKKTPASKAALKPFSAIEAQWLREDMNRKKTYEAAVEQHKGIARNGMQVDGSTPPPMPERPPMRQLTADDFTMEKLAHILADNERGILIACDELSGFIGGLDAYHAAGVNRDRPAALQLWNGGLRRHQRVKGSVSVPNWSASVFGNMPPEQLYDMAARGKMSDDGLLQRFLICNGRTLGTGVDRTPDAAALAAYDAVVRCLAERGACGWPIVLSADARPYWQEVEGLAYAMEQLPTSAPAFRSHLAKVPGLFARLLLTLHAIECAAAPPSDSGVPYIEREVSAATARRARDLMVRFFIPQAARTYGKLFAADLEPLRRVARFILAHGVERVTDRDIYRGVRELTGAEHAGERSRLMARLVEYDWLRPADPIPPITEWNVNPVVFERFAAMRETERKRRAETRSRIAAAAAMVRQAYGEG
jgi:hypothetical protein